MAPEKRIYDPEGDVILILTSPSKSSATLSSGTDTSDASSAIRTRGNLIHMQVSSKHLMLASRVFKTMFTSSFAEGEELRATGHIEVELPEDDHVAFTILMDIIHGKGPRIPRKVQFEVMATISTLVDKYELYDATVVFADIWIDQLSQRVSDMSSRNEADLLLWLSISWVFQKNSLFKDVTRELLNKIKFASNTALCDTLPIPQQILDAIQYRRKFILGAIFKEVSSYVEIFRSAYRDKDTFCPIHDSDIGLDCDAMVLGSFIQACSERNIYPIPEFPYEGHSTSSLLSDIADLRVRSLCDHTGMEAEFPGLVKGHGVAQSISLACSRLDVLWGGFDIGDFRRD